MFVLSQAAPAEVGAPDVLIKETVQDVVTIELAEGSTAGASIRLVDASGRLVARPVILPMRRAQFDMSGLTAGVYSLRLDDGDQHRVVRVIKQ